MPPKPPSHLKATLDNLWGWLVLAGFFMVPLVMFLAVFIQYRLATFKQAAMNEARASLSMALGDLPSVGVDSFAFHPPTPPGRLYGNFWIYAYTNNVMAGGINYPCVLATGQWDH